MSRCLSGEKEDWRKCVGVGVGKRSLNVGILNKGSKGTETEAMSFWKQCWLQLEPRRCPGRLRGN